MLGLLANVTGRLLPAIFDRLCRSGKFLMVGKCKCHTHLYAGQAGGLGELEADQHSSIPGKMNEELFLKAISRHLKNKDMTGNSQRGFAKDKLCLTNLIAFHDKMTSSMHKGSGCSLLKTWVMGSKQVCGHHQTEGEGLICWRAVLLFIKASTCWRTL